MGQEFKHGVFPSLLLIFALACLLPSSSGKDLGRLASSLKTGNGRQAKQFIFPAILGLAPEQDYYAHHPYILYNRNYLPSVKSAPQLGPFFGYFPNLFNVGPVGPVTTDAPTTTTTTTTVAPAPPPISCSAIPISGETASSCKPCPDGNAGGTIQSPNYPNDYGVSTIGTETKCLYKFTTSAGHKVKVVLSAGAVLDLSDDSPYLELLQLRGGSGDPIKFARGESFPTTKDLSYTIENNEPNFDFYFNSVACSKPEACKWEIKFSSE